MSGALEFQISQEPTGAEAPVQSERPPHVPEKFWDESTKSINTEALLKSYTELEKTRGAPAGQVQESRDGDKQAPEGDAAKAAEQAEADKADKAAEEAAAAAGIDMATLQKEVDETGDISEESKAKFEKLGFSREDIDGYIEWKKGRATAIVSEVQAAVGGADKYAEMTSWAAKSWTEAQIAEFNEAMSSNNRGRIDIAVKALQADFVKANGQRPNLIKPTGGSGVSGERYENFQQLLADQKNPLYRTDPAFRAKVAEKLSRSNIA
jgi:hypothetical protein